MLDLVLRLEDGIDAEICSVRILNISEKTGTNDSYHDIQHYRRCIVKSHDNSCGLNNDPKIIREDFHVLEPAIHELKKFSLEDPLDPERMHPLLLSA